MSVISGYWSVWGTMGYLAIKGLSCTLGIRTLGRMVRWVRGQHVHTEVQLSWRLQVGVMEFGNQSAKSVHVCAICSVTGPLKWHARHVLKIESLSLKTLAELSRGFTLLVGRFNCQVQLREDFSVYQPHSSDQCCGKVILSLMVVRKMVCYYELLWWPVLLTGCNMCRLIVCGC